MSISTKARSRCHLCDLCGEGYHRGCTGRIKPDEAAVVSWRCQYPRPPGITIHAPTCKAPGPRLGDLPLAASLGSQARAWLAYSRPDSEAPLSRRSTGGTGMMPVAVFGCCRRHRDGASGAGAVFVPAAGNLRSLPARPGGHGGCPESASAQVMGTGLGQRHVWSAVERVFFWQFSGLWRGRGNGPGKRAPARGGDVWRCRAAAGDVVRPAHTAPCGRCSIKRPGCVWCSCGWERGPSSRTKTGTALHLPGSTI